MATIGLDSLYYAPIAYGKGGNETYGAPVQLAKAMTASLSVEIAEGTLYADDALSEKVSEFKGGKLSLGIDDIGKEAAKYLTGATVDSNGVLVASTEDVPRPVAVGFRAKKSDGTYRYFWLYKVLFAVPGTELATKGDSISFSTPKIEGTIMRRDRADMKGKHPWKAELDERADDAENALVVARWFSGVYEPTFPIGIVAFPENAETGSSIRLAVTTITDAVSFAWYEKQDNNTDKLLATTTENSFTTNSVTVTGIHVYYCKITKPDGSTINSDTVSVRISDSAED